MMIHRRLLFGSPTAFSWITMPYLFFFEWFAPLVIVFGLAFMVAGAGSSRISASANSYWWRTSWA
jgi:hypothetical protein